MKFIFGAIALAALSLPALADQTASNPNPFLATEEAPPPSDEGSVNSKGSSLPAPNVPPLPAAVNTGPAPSTDAPIAATSQPEAQVPIPISSIPGKTAGAPKVDPNAVNAHKNIYEEYSEYLDRTREADRSEKDVRQRTLFPHENGAYQIALEYTRFAFSDYNFNFNNSGTNDSKGNPRAVFADSQGGALSFTYFPMRSMLKGRFGISGMVGIYWSKFTVETPSVDSSNATIGNTLTSTNKHSVDTIGFRGTYEFQYYLGQLLVPFAFMGYDRVKVQGYKVGVGNQTPLDIPGRSIGSTSVGIGTHFNLNRVEPMVASKALVNVGVRKFYLTYTMLQRLGDLSGLTHYLGLRFEY